VGKRCKNKIFNNSFNGFSEFSHCLNKEKGWGLPGFGVGEVKQLQQLFK
jgi:hypothetical protein